MDETARNSWFKLTLKRLEGREGGREEVREGKERETEGERGGDGEEGINVLFTQ